MLNSTERKISTAHKKRKYGQIRKFLALSLSGVVFVDILTFMSRITLCSVDLSHEKKCYELEARP